MDPIVVLIRDRREKVAALLELATHAAAAAALVTTGLGGLPAWLPAAQLAAGAALAAAVAHEVREVKRGGAEHGRGALVGWASVFAAAGLFLEVWQRVEAGGKFSWATLLTGVATLGLGLLQPRLARRRRERRVVRMDGDGVTVRTSKFRGFSLAWAAVRSVEVEPDRIRFALHGGGERRMGLRTVENRGEVVGAVLHGAAAAGVPGSGGERTEIGLARAAAIGAGGRSG
jgi:hypothetical protein